MFCTQCGNKLSDGAKFCAKCGHKVQEEIHAEVVNLIIMKSFKELIANFDVCEYADKFETQETFLQDLYSFTIYFIPYLILLQKYREKYWGCSVSGITMK